MLVKNVSTTTDEEFENILKSEIENIPSTIKTLLQGKKIECLIVDYTDDLLDEERRQKNNEFYKDDIAKKETTRGMMSDDSNCIAISIKNTKMKDIGAILYHELGHFLDAYDNFGKVDELGLSLSSNKKFIDAYNEDFINHYEQIKEDTNYRLVHFVQKSTPDKISQTGIIETFAELFRLACHKTNDTKTVELYFPSALQVLIEIVNERFDLKL